MGDKPNKMPYTLSLPKELLLDLSKGCTSYTPNPNTPFTPQEGDEYSPLHAEWCINAITYAYRQFCDKEKKDFYPPDVEEAQHLYWHEDFNIFQKKVSCGYIGRIKSLPNDPTNRIVIAFRGTEKAGEWLENVDYTQSEETFENLDHSVTIHTGFWDALNDKANYKTPSLQDQLNNLIPKYLKKDVPNEINITGHSLGAAIATLVTLDSILRYKGVRIVTFIIGTPRVGGPSLAELFRDLTQDPSYDFVVWRLVNTEDVVTTVPAPVLGDIVYSQVYISKPSDPNRVGGLTFSDNLGNIEHNHHPLLYKFANNQLLSDKKSKKPVKGVDEKPGDNKKSA
ncbi:MAG: lipase family protein [Chlamydiae bacterium]|nr:lipase family protein [Chlamydiota bacterium]